MNDHKEFLNIKQSFDVPDLREGSLVFPATRGWLCLWVSDIFFFLFLEYTELYVEKHSHFFTRLSSYIPKRKDEIDETLNSHIRTFGRLTSGKSTGPKSVQIHHPLHSQLRNQIRSTFLRGGLLDFKSTKWWASSENLLKRHLPCWLRPHRSAA